MGACARSGMYVGVGVSVAVCGCWWMGLLTRLAIGPDTTPQAVIQESISLAAHLAEAVPSRRLESIVLYTWQKVRLWDLGRRVLHGVGQPVSIPLYTTHSNHDTPTPIPPPDRTRCTRSWTLCARTGRTATG